MCMWHKAKSNGTTASGNLIPHISEKHRILCGEGYPSFSVGYRQGCDTPKLFDFWGITPIDTLEGGKLVLYIRSYVQYPLVNLLLVKYSLFIFSYLLARKMTKSMHRVNTPYITYLTPSMLRMYASAVQTSRLVLLLHCLGRFVQTMYNKFCFLNLQLIFFKFTKLT